MDIFLLKTPFARKKDEQLTENYWAQRRASEPQSVRVPATLFAQEMYDSGVLSGADRAQKKKKSAKKEGKLLKNLIVKERSILEIMCSPTKFLRILPRSGRSIPF